MTYAYPFALLSVSFGTFVEVAEKLRAAGYDQAFQELDGAEVIDMHGVALRTEPGNSEWVKQALEAVDAVTGPDGQTLDPAKMDAFQRCLEEKLILRRENEKLRAVVDKAARENLELRSALEKAR